MINHLITICLVLVLLPVSIVNAEMTVKDREFVDRVNSEMRQKEGLSTNRNPSTSIDFQNEKADRTKSQLSKEKEEWEKYEKEQEEARRLAREKYEYEHRDDIDWRRIRETIADGAGTIGEKALYAALVFTILAAFGGAEVMKIAILLFALSMGGCVVSMVFTPTYGGSGTISPTDALQIQMDKDRKMTKEYGPFKENWPKR